MSSTATAPITIKKRFDRRKLTPYLLVSPFFVFFLIFGLYPTIYSLTMSFMRFSPGLPGEFVGFENYEILLTRDPFFWKSINNTIYLLIFGSLLQHVIAIPLAILLNSKLVKARNFFRTTFFLPFVTSTVAVVIIFTRIFANRYGVANWALVELFNLEAVEWISNRDTIKIVISVVLNWKWIGWNTILYLAGLQQIDNSLYEAAEIDGASTWQKHTRITLPLLAPIIFFATTTSLIGGMLVFDEPFVLTGGYELFGGTDNAGLTTAFYIMQQGMRWLRFGRASAVAWLLFIVIFIFTIFNRYVNRRLEEGSPKSRNRKNRNGLRV